MCRFAILNLILYQLYNFLLVIYNCKDCRERERERKLVKKNCKGNFFFRSFACKINFYINMYFFYRDSWKLRLSDPFTGCDRLSPGGK